MQAGLIDDARAAWYFLKDGPANGWALSLARDAFALAVRLNPDQITIRPNARGLCAGTTADPGSREPTRVPPLARR